MPQPSRSLLIVLGFGIPRRNTCPFLLPPGRGKPSGLRREAESAVAAPFCGSSLWMLHQSGAVLQVEVHSSRTDYNGRPAVMGVLLDITVRKQAEAALRESEATLRDQQFYTRSLIESNIDALIATDPRGIITDVNKQMEALTGCTRDELIGAPFKDCFTDANLADAAIKLVLSKKKIINYELTARARDGKETVVSYNATTFYDRDRKLQGVFAAARDITERK